MNVKMNVPSIEQVRANLAGALKMQGIAEAVHAVWKTTDDELTSPETAQRFTSQYIDELRATNTKTGLDALDAAAPDAARNAAGGEQLWSAYADPLPLLAANARFAQIPDTASEDGVAAQNLEATLRIEARDLVRTADPGELVTMIADARTGERWAMLALLAREVPKRTDAGTAAKSALVAALDSIALPDEDAAEEMLTRARRALEYFDAIRETIRTNGRIVPSSVSFHDWQVRDAAEKEPA